MLQPKRQKADKAPELIAQAHVYGGWESSLDHTEGDDGIPVPLAPDLGLNQGRAREVAAADCLDKDTAVPFPGRAHSGPSVQWPEPHFKERTSLLLWGALC
ncbi:hypothetical protein B5X24_HaOG216728 [Helicoverpa armigera]|uniref:Uncharacterized protein n=1 Tax=Helicoverpa armigera TaxID=29058 RepID=A0A2W1CP52_HELAM|nr:hypothetical protein B5X24_HaOG216728 [Helicoverpa armigera]